MRPVFRKLSVLLIVAMILVLSGCSDQYLVLDPKGPIASAQKDLILISSLICLIIAVPVIAMTAVIVWRYRERPNSKAKYKPYWEHSTKLEAIWWGIPIVAIAILAVITVDYTHKLEPSVAIESEQKPIEIQVTSLDWKWLFTYPDEEIATINYVKFPVDTPVVFKLTSDMAMNSFWIPSLGGQLYAMSGMAMTLNLLADEEGVYYGSGANFTGKDFAQMTFNADVTTKEEYDRWVQEVKTTEVALTDAGVDELKEPGTAEVAQFSSFPENLFYNIMTQYVEEGETGAHAHHMTSEASKPDDQAVDEDSSEHHNH
ncbi:MAG: ubiquinol oxidase subunit II [Candidatus Pristimantibacillus lignocellulolyticus]|uniref:Quinol oxidase subunit 2 n=1 Tax=Candidatus Pristimantibacillus lignocellulolyticus TaxID=2994561 RepID=A0A9J6ZHB9_9BACL|nr:MAG: ubiquinol oxidase subunit II [Candidatus Pristimantibacillus lignocellulolyticus]